MVRQSRTGSAALAALTMLALATAPATAQEASDAAEPTIRNVDPDRFGAEVPDAAYGAYQRGFYLTAFNLAMPRAEAGDAAAQTLVAEILARGLGVRRDEKQAAQWYSKAAEQGVVEAKFRLAMMLIQSDDVEPDPERAYELMEQAADAGNPRAQFNFAQMVVERDQSLFGMERAMSYYELAAEAGIPDAQYALALAYANGVGGKPLDMEEARRWMTLAAMRNFDTAQVDLGTWLIEGRFGEADPETGFAWLLRAARGGNVAARNRVAKLYMAGIGVAPDAIEAATWYLRARRAGLDDPVMEDHLAGLTEEQRNEAAERAERLR